MSGLRLDPVEGILAVLDSGSVTGANKFGLLLALIDLAPAVPADGLLEVRTIAEHLIELHWEHARPFKGAALRQVTSGNRRNTTVLLAVEELRDGLDPSVPFERARPLIADARWRAAVDKVAYDTKRNPLTLLQNLPGNPPPFLYEILPGSPACIRFLDGAIADLVRFGPVLRDLVEFRFARFVAAANHKLLGPSIEDEVAEHLFGMERHMPPLEMRHDLWELQQGRCVYTGRLVDDPLLRSGTSSLDHVVPWARVRLSSVENFVLTDRSTNSQKQKLLLAPPLVERWATHLHETGGDMARIASAYGWPADRARVLAVAEALYKTAPASAAAWDGHSVAPLDVSGRERVLSALASLGS